MAREAFAEMNCPIARTLAVIGDWWTPLIVRDLFAGVSRFEAIQGNLGIPRKVLSQRLVSLLANGVIERTPYQDNPTRYDYRLTEKGFELGSVLLVMKSWGDRWTPIEEAPARLRHERCGEIIEPRLSCSGCGEPLLPGELTLLSSDEVEVSLAPPLVRASTSG